MGCGDRGGGCRGRGAGCRGGGGGAGARGSYRGRVPNEPASSSAREPRARRPDAAALAADLSGRSDADLAALLTARPDLARPAPADLATLAARAWSPASLRRALDGLDRAHLTALEAAVVAGDGHATTGDVAVLLGCSDDRADALLHDLHTRGLLLHDETGAGVPRTLLDVLGTVAGLAPPHRDDAESARRIAATTPATDPEGVLRALTDSAPVGAAEILTRLTWGPATGTLDPSGPLGPAVRHLLAHGLLRLDDGADPGSVTLPRPVALALRGGRIAPPGGIDPPPVTPRPMRDVDAAAGSQAGDALALLEEIATAWGENPPRVLRTGGLSVRDLAAATRLTGLDTHLTGTLLEVGHAAGLLGQDAGVEPVWAPTDAYDTWLETDDARRWALLALAWRDLPRAPGRIGGRGESGPINAFSAELTVGPALLDLRRRTLSVLADLDLGLALTADEVVARLRWTSPRMPEAFVEAVVRDTLAEAEMLGVCVGGALGAAGRALLVEPPAAQDAPAGDSGRGAAPRIDTEVDAEIEQVASAVHLAEPVDHLYLQADLTAIAPGRLDTRTAAFLRLAADVESRGGATTYRFSTASVRRLLDAGWEVDDVLRTLERLSRSGVPQPLEFLVRDAARGYGVARIGSAGCYLRSDDVAALDALLALPEAAPARLRRLAPTVLVSPLVPTQLLTLLRGVDVHALLEGPDGTVVPGSLAPTRALPRRRRPRIVSTPPDVDAVVAALRAASGSGAGPDTGSGTVGARGSTPDDVLRSDPAITLSRLRQAAAEGGPVWIGVARAGGEVVRRHVRPTRVSGGLVHGVDLTTGRADSWPASRITGARPDDDPPTEDPTATR